jgi:hypothetical protein
MSALKILSGSLAPFRLLPQPCSGALNKLGINKRGESGTLAQIGFPHENYLAMIKRKYYRHDNQA